MTNQRPFGRRSNPQPQPIRARLRLDGRVPSATSIIADVPPGPSSHQEITVPYVDDELRGREQAVERPFKMPWRQLSLMASLCFGIASFVLPDSVNDQLDWLLYGLMALSAYAGLSKRFLGS
jgi:hypothetical protein